MNISVLDEVIADETDVLRKLDLIQLRLDILAAFERELYGYWVQL